jgi:hypothetical protein
MGVTLFLYSYILYNSLASDTNVATVTLVFEAGLILFAGYACISKVNKQTEKVDVRLWD